MVYFPLRPPIKRTGCTAIPSDKLPIRRLCTLDYFDSSIIGSQARYRAASETFHLQNTPSSRQYTWLGEITSAGRGHLLDDNHPPGLEPWNLFCSSMRLL